VALALLAGATEVSPQSTDHAAKVVAALKEKAAAGDTLAPLKLGLIYYRGYGVPQNYEQAAYWFHKAADAGYSDAQFYLGVMFAHGEKVPQDYAEAYFWLDVAAAGDLDPENMKDDVKERDLVAAHLTKTALLQTQERARKWFESHPAKK
jgi:hypothetical protein